MMPWTMAIPANHTKDPHSQNCGGKILSKTQKFSGTEEEKQGTLGD
jgi:hypothetical protein